MDELERQAITIFRQYRFVLLMNKPVRDLMKQIAERLDWKTLHKEL